MQEAEIKALVIRAQGGDVSALDALTRLYRDRLVAVVRSRIGQKLRRHVEAEDIVQETFLRAYAAIGKFTWRGEGSFTSWLNKIAEHLIWNVSQKRPCAELSIEAEPEDTATTPEQRLRRDERFHRLEAAMAELRPDQREAIRLSRIERLKIAEIAERMGRSPGSVKMLLARALRQLKSSLRDTDSFHLPDRELNLQDREHGE